MKKGGRGLSLSTLEDNKVKKRVGLIVALGLFASLGSMQAVIVPCTNTTLAALIALGAGAGNGCSVNDKLFNNFSYTPGASAPVAGSVNATLQANDPTLTYGFSFSSSTGSFVGNFVLGFTVGINTAICPTCLITSTAEQLLAGTGPPGTVSISVAESAGPSPVLISNASFGANTNGSTIAPGVLTLTKSATATGISSSNPLLSFESDVRQTNTIPEPGTFLLLGGALLGLSALRYRRAA